MAGFSVRDMLRSADAQSGSTATVSEASGLASPKAPPKQLSDLAARIASEAVATAYSPIVLSGMVRLFETTIVLSLGFAIYMLYVWPTVGFYWVTNIGMVAIALLALVTFEAMGLYDVSIIRTIPSQAGRLVIAWTMVFLIAFATAFFFKTGGEFSRVWLTAWYFSGLLLLFPMRVGLAHMVSIWSRSGRLKRRAVIVGGGDSAQKLISSLALQGDTDVSICGFFDDRTDDRSLTDIGGVPKLGTVDDLVQFARQTRVDLVIVTLPISAESRVLDMVRKLWILPVDIRLSAHTAKLRFRPRAYSYVGNVPVLDVFDRPIADWDLVLKWLFDKIVGTLALIALMPLFIVTAIAIKLDSRGPIFFRQKRYGFNNELTEVFKFRSMYVDQADAGAAKLVTKGDPRVTRVGRFIRKTSIDELPQLLNVVFKGNLSLVGPRPHAVHAKAANQLYNDVVDGYFARHKVKPGITGWAQINGWRGETDTPEKIQQRVEHDLFYIENWSVLFDLYILARTPFSLLTHTENAY